MNSSPFFKIKSRGFTLIELMVTIAIIGILAAIVYPSYTSILEKTRRQEAMRTLLEASQYMESYYAMNLSYSAAVSGGLVTGFTANSDFTDYYALTAVAGTSTFTLSATPSGGQSADSCGTLTITNTGATSAATTECW